MKKPNLKCDFGQYNERWKNYNENCKKIIRITDYYIVFIDKGNNIDWETTEKYDSLITKDTRSFQEKHLSQCSIIEHKPTVGLSEVSILSFKTIVGEAIVNSLEDNFDGSTDILRQADEFRLDRVIEKSREWYLSYTLIITAILIFSVIWLNFNTISYGGILENINIGVWAVVGACLSIILRSGDMLNVSYAGKKLHFIDSGCRLVAGFISGQIVYLGVKSGIIFSSFYDSDNSQYIICFFALLAGASERFAPSIISKVEDSASLTETLKENTK